MATVRLEMAEGCAPGTGFGRVKSILLLRELRMAAIACGGRVRWPRAVAACGGRDPAFPTRREGETDKERSPSLAPDPPRPR